MTEHKYTTVGQTMSSPPRIIDGLATVRDAMHLLRDHKISALVIDRRHKGDEYGLVAVHDIADKVIGRNLSADRTNVYEIMSKPVLTLDVDMDIRYAVRLLTRFKLSRALVTREGEVVGLVTLRDMVLRSVPPAAEREG